MILQLGSCQISLKSRIGKNPDSSLSVQINFHHNNYVMVRNRGTKYIMYFHMTSQTFHI